MFGLNGGMRYYVCQRFVRMNMGINTYISDSQVNRYYALDVIYRQG